MGGSRYVQEKEQKQEKLLAGNQFMYPASTVLEVLVYLIPHKKNSSLFHGPSAQLSLKKIFLLFGESGKDTSHC